MQLLVALGVQATRRVHSCLSLHPLVASIWTSNLSSLRTPGIGLGVHPESRAISPPRPLVTSAETLPPPGHVQRSQGQDTAVSCGHHQPSAEDRPPQWWWEWPLWWDRAPEHSQGAAATGSSAGQDAVSSAQGPPSVPESRAQSPAGQQHPGPGACAVGSGLSHCCCCGRGPERAGGGQQRAGRRTDDPFLPGSLCTLPRAGPCVDGRRGGHDCPSPRDLQTGSTPDAHGQHVTHQVTCPPYSKEDGSSSIPGVWAPGVTLPPPTQA